MISMICNPRNFHTFAVEITEYGHPTILATTNNILIMAKIGYIMAAAHYDKLEEDRQWMQEEDNQ